MLYSWIATTPDQAFQDHLILQTHTFDAKVPAAFLQDVNHRWPIYTIIALSSSRLWNICQLNRCTAAHCLLFTYVLENCSTPHFLIQQTRILSHLVLLKYNFNVISSSKKENTKNKTNHPTPSKQITEYPQMNLLAALLLEMDQVQNMQEEVW